MHGLCVQSMVRAIAQSRHGMAAHSMDCFLNVSVYPCSNKLASAYIISRILYIDLYIRS